MRLAKVGFYRVRISSYIKYGEFTEQGIKYENLNYENSLFNTLEYFAAIFIVGEDFTSIFDKVLQTLSCSQLIQNKLFNSNIY